MRQGLTSGDIDAGNICTIPWLVEWRYVTKSESVEASFASDGVVYGGDR